MDVPHFTVTTESGARVTYTDIWQRENLLLVVLDESPASSQYISGLNARLAELTTNETRCVVTREPVGEFGRPAVIIADRWGVVHFSSAPSAVSDLPGPDALIEWLRYVQMQCPECQGEAR